MESLRRRQAISEEALPPDLVDTTVDMTSPRGVTMRIKPGPEKAGSIHGTYSCSAARRRDQENLNVAARGGDWRSD